MVLQLASKRKYTSRFIRSNFPPQFVLTPRDIEIVRVVTRHRFLNSVHIERLIKGSAKHLRERLKGLYWNGHLDRPCASANVLRPGGGSYPCVYALGSKGARLLIDEDGIDAARIGWTKKNNSARRPFIEHTLAISDLATSLFAATDARADISFDDMDALTAALPAKRRDMAQPFAWRVSTLLKGQRHTLGLAPDYAFSLKSDNLHSEHFYMVECDRGTMPVKRYGDDPFTRTSIFKKLIAYQAGWKQGYHRQKFGWPNFRVLFITTTRARSEHMRACLRDMTHSKGSPLFWFTDRESLKQSSADGDILDHHWIDGHDRQQNLWREK